MQWSKRLLKNGHLRRYSHPSSLRRTPKYAAFLGISSALHLGIFDQPKEIEFFEKILRGCRETKSGIEKEGF